MPNLLLEETKPKESFPPVIDVESERMAGRREVRRRLAELDVIKQRAQVFQKQIAGLDAEADEAANSHQAVCKPLQVELSEIEDRIAACLCDRLPVPAELETRRLEIVGEIENQNQILEAIVSRIKVARKRVGIQKRDAMKDYESRGPIERKLAISPLANPTLLIEQFVSQQDEQWHQSRLRFAQKKLADAVSLRDSTRFHNEQAVYQVRIDRWTAEIQHVQQLLAAAMQKTKEIYEKLINE